MRIRSKILFAFSLISGIAIATAIFVTTTSITATGKTHIPDKMIEGWTFYASPYITPEYQSNPVIVSSVTTDSAKGLTITKVKIKNRSEELRSIKLRWYLCDERNNSIILQEGESAELRIEGGLSKGETKEIEHEIVAGYQLLKNLKQSQLNNAAFHICVEIGAVTFENGKRWNETRRIKSEHGLRAKLVKASFTHGVRLF